MSRAAKEISPIEIYKYLPKTNCGACGEKTCMAFATKLANREARLEECPELLKPEYKEAYQALWEMLKPPVKEVVIGSGDRAVKVGGKYVMYRHELTYHNPTPIAIDVEDTLEPDAIRERVKRIQEMTYEYIGRLLKLDGVAVRCVSGDAEKFKQAVQVVAEETDMPLILCCLNPDVLEYALVTVYERRPLLYAATKENWREMAELATGYKCPLAVFAPGDIALLRSLVKTLTAYGVEDLVLDPGTFPGEGFSDTLNNFTMIRRAACKQGDELLGFPLLGVPAVAWLDKEAPYELKAWNEACMAVMLLTRFADLLIMHSLDGWVQLPVMIWRENIYTDPRKPVSVEPGLRTFGQPDEMSPVLVTTNYALTYFTVENDIKAAKLDCYLIVVDTEGLSVQSAVAGRKLTAELIADAIKESGIEERVKHRYVVIPGLAARLSGELEELSGWRVLVGPKDSSAIPKFFAESWPPKEEG
ncbi:MAG TPA: acetyl-CoA decarbonylase/synthase complex subunit gamma [Candidatus Bathyarchaeota archaeon]|nr:acetyl-CoA decarbonylase/synthase complex subunit gamma [Candidatus Bathyarchaeota archaeon]